MTTSIDGARAIVRASKLPKKLAELGKGGKSNGSQLSYYDRDAKKTRFLKEPLSADVLATSLDFLFELECKPI